MEVNKIFKLIASFLSLLDLYANIFEKNLLLIDISIISNFYSCYRIKNKINLQICLRSFSFVLFSIYFVYIVSIPIIFLQN